MSFSMWQKLSAAITASTVPPAAVRCPAVVSLTRSLQIQIAAPGTARRKAEDSAPRQTLADRRFLVTKRNRIAANARHRGRWIR